MSENQTPDTDVQDELAALKARADLMGIPYSPNIGLDALRKKVNAKLESEEAPTAKSTGSKAKSRGDLRKEAAKLVRIRLTNMNPNKKDWEGEFFTAGNAMVGSFTKFVPFNIGEDGYHVPQIILNQIRERKFMIFEKVKGVGDVEIKRPRLVPEFAIEVLSPLTEKELKELAQRQRMARGDAL